MLIRAYFNLPYMGQWHPTWLQHCDPKNEILQALF